MKHGAYHYANKPFNLDEIALLVEKALETTRLRREVRTLRATQAQPLQLRPHRRRQPGARDASRRCCEKVASSPASTVLLTGESGTGKDLAAKVIHYNSDRAPKPFMNITCSALPEALLESELFGHERGAFTGADRQKRGLLETADGGTVFLDEIGEMVPALQAKLLRFLEEKTFKRVGGAVDIHVDVRVIAATNRKLEEEVRAGRFREDLFYRLNVLPIVLPPLRERADDIPLLVEFYVDAYNAEFKKRVRGVAPRRWSGCRRTAGPATSASCATPSSARCCSPRTTALAADDFTIGGRGPCRLSDRVELPPSGIDLEQLERSLVVQALERTGWNQTRAAALLGLNRDQIRYRIEKFHLEKTRRAH